MKKSLIRLAIPSLTILPLTAISSCSSTIESATLEMEVLKFKEPIKANDSQTTTLDVVESIVNAPTGLDRISALKTYVDIPKLSKGFTYAVKSATINSATNTHVDVKIVINDILLDKSMPTVLTITDLTSTDPSIETEVIKFASPIETKKPFLTASEAAKTIASSNNANGKLEALKNIVDVPILSPGFALEVIEALVDPLEKKSLNVKINISKVESAESQMVTLVVTDFSLISLTEEAVKFNAAVKTLTPEIGAQAAVYKINKSTDKLTTLKMLASVPSLSPGFSLEVLSVEIDKTNLREIIVKMNLMKLPKNFININSNFQKSTNETKLPVTLKVTGFALASELEKAAALFTPVVTKEPLRESSNYIGNIIKSRTFAQRLVELKKVADVPIVKDTIKIEINTADMNPNNERTMDVFITLRDVNATQGPKTIDIIFSITGFDALSGPGLSIIKLYKKSELLVDKQVLPGKANETASQAAATINNDATLDQYYSRIELGDGIWYEWRESLVEGKSLAIKVFVRTQWQGFYKWFTISGFK